VRALAADPARRAAYGAAGRAMVEGRTWAVVGDQLIGHYEDVLSARKLVAAPLTSKLRARSVRR